MEDIAITPQSFLLGLYIVIGVFVLVILYHLLFVVVDLRKIMRRINELTEEVEAVVMRPISMIDQLLEWLTEFVEASLSGDKKNKK